MQDYERPTIEEVGTVAELTQAVGIGMGSDSSYPLADHYASAYPEAHDHFTHS